MSLRIGIDAIPSTSTVQEVAAAPEPPFTDIMKAASVPAQHGADGKPDRQPTPAPHPRHQPFEVRKSGATPSGSPPSTRPEHAATDEPPQVVHVRVSPLAQHQRRDDSRRSRGAASSGSKPATSSDGPARDTDEEAIAGLTPRSIEDGPQGRDERRREQEPEHQAAPSSQEADRRAIKGTTQRRRAPPQQELFQQDVARPARPETRMRGNPTTKPQAAARAGDGSSAQDLGSGGLADARHEAPSGTPTLGSEAPPHSQACPQPPAPQTRTDREPHARHLPTAACHEASAAEACRTDPFAGITFANDFDEQFWRQAYHYLTNLDVPFDFDGQFGLSFCAAQVMPMDSALLIASLRAVQQDAASLAYDLRHRPKPD